MAAMQVFLSHSSADRDVAEQVVTALRGAGADVWFDEHNLGATQLLDEIARQLRTRPVFIVLLSKAAFASDWVKRECKWAFNIQMRNPSHIILPLLVTPIDPDAFDEMLYLEDFKRIEQRDHTPYPHDEMIAQTLRLLALTPAGAAPTPVTPQPAESVDDLLTQGRALSAQKRWGKALTFFQRATERAPRNVDAWGAQGATLAELKRYAEALTACDRSLALNDQQAWVWNNKGTALGGLGRYEEELAALDRALALDPNLVTAWHNKGVVLDGLGRGEEALVAYDRALALDPSYVFSWNNKGLALYLLNKYDEALTAYDCALTANPNDAAAWSGKGLTLRELGRATEAKAAERRAKELGR